MKTGNRLLCSHRCGWTWDIRLLPPLRWKRGRARIARMIFPVPVVRLESASSSFSWDLMLLWDMGKWWKMMENDGKWWKMMENDGKWWKMMENYGKWWKMGMMIMMIMMGYDGIWRSGWDAWFCILNQVLDNQPGLSRFLTDRSLPPWKYHPEILVVSMVPWFVTG